jgi:predicted Zn-dependent protease
MLKFSRGAEVEADQLGVQYLYAAGYDPNGMATMFEKLSAMNKKKSGKLTKLFATHPESLQRRDASLALAARFPEHEEYILSTSEFQRVKAHLMRLSNAKASVAGDIDDSGENGRPTLKRRQPAPDDSTATPSSNDTSDDKKDEQKERPQLNRRGEAPTATPTPAPTPNQ